MFKKKILIPLLVLSLMFSIFMLLPKARAYEEYVPTFVTFKSDNFETLDIPTDDAQKARDYMWGYSYLFWVETNNTEIVTSKALAGSKSMKWSPGYVLANDGWTAGSEAIGISPSKLAGSEGGYLLKLDFLVKLIDVDRLVVKAVDSDSNLRQEIVIKDDYTLDDNPSIKDDGEETSISIEKMGTAGNEYAHVEFVVRSSVSLTTFYTFTLKTRNSSSAIILDNVNVSKETDPDLPYRHYKEHIVEGFENESLAQSIFTGTSTNVDETLTSFVKEKAFRGQQTLELFPEKRNIKSVINSKDYTLEASNYKLYFKCSANRLSKIGVNVVKKSDDSIIYNFIINPTSGERVDSVINPLFDASQFYIDSTKMYTAYGEFSIEESTEVYLQLYFNASNIAGSAKFDDVNILKEYQLAPAPTSLNDSTSVKVNGTVDAQYEAIDGLSNVKDKAGVNSLSATITTIVISLVVITGLVLMVIYWKGKKKYIFLLLVLLALTSSVLVACKNNSESEIPAGYSVVTPEKLSGKLDNPGMGWVILEEPTYGGHIDIGSSGEFPETDYVSLSTSWSHIETSEGVYDFTMCDQAVDYWTGLNKKVLLRISTDNYVLPYTYKACPDYLFEKYNVGYETVDYLDPGPVRTCRVTDLTDQNYLHFLDLFLKALYEHYQDNDMVDTVEIRGFGTWGEWHHGHSFESKTDRMVALENIILKYYDVFKESNKILAVSASWDPDYINTNEYSVEANGDALETYLNFVKWSAFDKAWRLPSVTYRRDGGANALRYDLDERLLAEAFRSGKRIPILAEYANNYAAIMQTGSAYTLMSAIDDIIYKIRPNNCTVLGWVAVELANIVNTGNTEFIDRGNTMMGYRLSVDEARFPSMVSASTNFRVKTTWSNSAAGIYPYLSPLEFKLLDSSNKVVYSYQDNKFDARLLVQGEIIDFYTEMKIPSSVANGKYKLAIDIPYENTNIKLGMAGEIEDTGLYVLGEIELKDKVKLKDDGLIKTTWNKIRDVKLEKNSIYEITYRYMPHFDMNNFFFGNNDCYQFSLTSAKLNDTRGLYSWQDISGEAGLKTVIVTTGNSKDYQINIKSINFDNIGVDEVWIEKVEGTSFDFSGYDVTNSDTLVEPIRLDSADKEENSIQGDSLVLNSPNNEGKHILAKVDINNFAFKKGTNYTVSFDFRAGGDVAEGGYYFLALGKYSEMNKVTNAKFDVIGEWYERDDNYDTKKTFSFTPTEDAMSIAFGINAKGSYYIDNLIIAAKKISSYIEGEDLGFAHNVVPHYSDIGLNKTETFERGTFQSSGFEWGQFAWGRITFKENEVVGYNDDVSLGDVNKASLLGRVEKEVYNPTTDTVWFEFMRSKREYYPVEANKYYRVQFDYMILKSYASGKCFCFFRDDTLSDRFVQAINNPYLKTDESCDLSSGKNLLTVYHFDEIFLMKDFNNYQFMMCMNGLWEMSVDNILIEEVEQPLS